MSQRYSQERRRRSREYVDPKTREAGYGPQSPSLPQYNHNGDKVTPGIQPDGESGRRGIHPLKFLRICFRGSCRASMVVNFLWPIVPIAIALVSSSSPPCSCTMAKTVFQHFIKREMPLAIFITNYIAMVPAANLVGFAGQEFSRKLPKSIGVLVETTFGSVVEIILFMTLLKTGGERNVPVIRAAILGSILANMLLCLGACFFVGGLKRREQEFHPAVAEAGSGLMLVAGSRLAFSHLSGAKHY